MTLAARRRLEAVERRIGSTCGCVSLDREIRAMTSEERDLLRVFLEYHRDGGFTGDSEYEILKAAAETAITSARKRLSVDQNIPA